MTCLNKSCPQRAERLGWTGDAQVYAPTASYHMDTRAFYRKFLIDLRTEQLDKGGEVPNYIPAMDSGGGAAVWGDAATIIPMALVDAYNSKADLSIHYNLMKDWVNWNRQRNLSVKGKPATIIDYSFQFGDWLALDGATQNSFVGGTDSAYIASVYYWQSLNLLIKAAGILGKNEDVCVYQELANQQRDIIFSEYFTETGRLAIDTQAAYIIALKFGLYKDREKIIAQFLLRLKKDLYKIKCGFVGAPLLAQVLAEIGRFDLAYDFLLNEKEPSWLFAVNMGATTIWERWNSILADGTMNPSGMNSLNHYSYGSIMEFVYQSVVGIKAMNSGFQHVLLSPQVDIRLGFAKGIYHSVAGTYVSEWKIQEDGQIHCHFTVPFNAKATIRLPESGLADIEVQAGEYDYCYTPIRYLRKKYSEHTRLIFIKEDELAIVKLEKTVPILAGFIQRANEEQLHQTLLELTQNFFTGITREIVDAALESLAE